MFPLLIIKSLSGIDEDFFLLLSFSFILFVFSNTDTDVAEDAEDEIIDDDMEETSNAEDEKEDENGRDR